MGTATLDTCRYGDFRQGVFASDRKLDQHFFNVHIEQDGAVAQASVDFVTRLAGTQTGSYGWKTIQLLRIRGEWKIASEFYTAYAPPVS